MEKISKDIYDILTQVTFKVKTRSHVFFFFKHKSKNTQRVWGENRLLKFLLQKMLQNVFYLHRFCGREAVPYHYWFHQVSKLMYRFRFYFVCCDRFTIIFRIMRSHDASIILIEINVYLFRTGHSISFYSSLQNSFFYLKCIFILHMTFYFVLQFSLEQLLFS